MHPASSPAVHSLVWGIILLHLEVSMDIIIQTLQKQSFVEAVILLLITAVITGSLVPYVKSKIDRSTFERQKQFEDTLAKQKHLREDKAKLFDDLESLLWEYQFLALEPSYFAMRGNAEGFNEAMQQYDKKASILFAQIRAKISKLGRLATTDTYQKFNKLFETKLVPLDMELIGLFERKEEDRQIWNDHHSVMWEKLGKDIRVALYALAKDFGYTETDAGINTEYEE